LDEQEILLEAPRYVQGPSRIAEMPAQLARDRGHGESAEGAAAARVKTRQRLEETDVAHLEMVIEGENGEGEVDDDHFANLTVSLPKRPLSATGSLPTRPGRPANIRVLVRGSSPPLA
jgi:hypothetical protein